MSKKIYDVVVIGGGLAGLCTSIHLAKSGLSILLIEKNEYPRHKVCGEYVSNEVLPYLEYLGIDPFQLGAKSIKQFELTTHNNKSIKAKLPLGGFGISRYTLDNELYKLALREDVQVRFDMVTGARRELDRFIISTKSGSEFVSDLVIGSYGKRSNLDVKFDRQFIKRKSPYLAVKTHVSGSFPANKVALHNFQGGYCGVSKVENDHINLCYITNYKSFKAYKDIESFQEQVMFKNDSLKEIFTSSDHVFDKPLTISQISFETKNPIENGIIMCGDSAGMIHPLCGNGMGMAIGSAKLASELIIQYFKGELSDKNNLFAHYQKAWKKAYSLRLKAGHSIAYLFRQDWLAPILLNLLSWFPFLTGRIIKLTHGKPLEMT